MRTLWISAAVLGLVLSAVPGAVAEPARADRSGAGADERRAVTLVTGDRVLVHNGNSASVTPGPGRTGILFHSYKAQGHTYVVPADAQQLISEGRVDRRLFDVTTLLEYGYTNATPLIVTGQGVRAGLRAAATRDLSAINGIALTVGDDGDTWRALTGDTLQSGAERIWLDGKRRATLDRSTRQIGAPAAWDAGFTGTGVTVAVLDTGVDETHPDLADRQIAEQNFSDAPDAVDHFGHGTHVASIIAGTGARASGKYRGVAHGASILDGKVLNDRGFGSDSGIIAGMQWAVEQGADIVNLSLGDTDFPGIDPMEEAVNTLSAQHGTLFVIAAGNAGEDRTILTPGSADAALTVGAVDRDDNLARFSSRGPRTGDSAIKPDVTAPGVGIVAALHADGTINPPTEPGYTAISGTSMATPHVAGAAALLAQQHPDWTGAQLKAVLSASAKPTDGLTAFEQGAGRIDVAKAIGQTVVSEPASVSFGFATFPHDDDEPVTKPVTYRNLGSDEVTLSLSVDTTAPNGLFSLSANEVTVPAGGTAQVTVTADTRVGDTDGYLSSAVTATAGDTTVRTAVAVERELETYELTLNFIDERGAPTTRYGTLVLGHDNDTFVQPYDEDGSVTLRLPRGNYLVESSVTTTKSGAPHGNLILRPNLALTADTTVTVDPRVAKPIQVTPPAQARFAFGDIGYDVAGGHASAWLVFDDLSTLSTAQVGPPLKNLVGKINTQWVSGNGTYYGLAWFPAEGVPTGFTKAVRQRDLAAVRAEFGAVQPGRTGQRTVFPHHRDGGGYVLGVPIDVPAPGVQTHYVNADGASWTNQFTQVGEVGGELFLASPLRSYRRGRTYPESFNHGVFGPSLPDIGTYSWVMRRENTLDMLLPLYGDHAGNSGFSSPNSTTSKLFLGDELIGERTGTAGLFENLPPGKANYRLAVESTRPATFDLSPAVNVEWTFSSKHAPGGKDERVPISAIRYLPKLDAANSAPAGRPFLIPTLLQTSDGELARARDLVVEVSYDEGRTWRKATVRAGAVAVVYHPAGATSVSLRASATDRDGNTVKQTIIRAYKLR